MLVLVLNKQYYTPMVAWLKVGITTSYHKDSKCGAEAVRGTMSPHITASSSILLRSDAASCLHLSQERKATPVNVPHSIVFINTQSCCAIQQPYIVYQHHTL